jgi:hypothetical protein
MKGKDSMPQRFSKSMSVLSAIVAVVVFVLPSCTSTHVETKRDLSEVKFDKSELKKVGVSVIYRDGKRIGTIEKHRRVDGDNNDANDRYVTMVLNTDGDRIGCVTDDFRAYRFRAHGEPEIVANHPEYGNNVLAIFGYYDGKVEFEHLVVVN